MPPIEKNPAELTPEQEEILQNVFLYEEAGDLSESDIETLTKMFDTPQKFVLLRRALQVLTPAERGMTIKDSKTFIEASPSDVTKYAFEMAVDLRADEKVRQSLVSLYMRVRKAVAKNMKEGFEKENQEAFDEAEQTEDYDAKQAEENRTLGPNL